MNFQNLYWVWLVVGFLLIFAELFLVSFTILWFGIGALLTGLIYYFFPHLTLGVQFFIWSIASIIITLLWFFIVKPWSNKEKIDGKNIATLQGEIGLVVRIGDGEKKSGTLRLPAPLLGNDEWEFVANEKIELGDRVEIIDFVENLLHVKKI